ncbi:MAG: nucleoside triphosphate pyrophosphohydrolase [Anaerolineales bacterium]|nr:MAG: nucleoside triphosphate pyrophosphohydrolase [Anaerolineales bacterium]
MSAGLTILGLGPSSGDLLTRQAWEILSHARELYVRTRNHPALDELPQSLTIHAFDQLYNQANSFPEVYEAIVTRLMELAQREPGVIYAVPGDPSVGEATVARLRELAEIEGLPLKLVPGISFIEPCLALLELDALDGLFIADALELVEAHHPGFMPDTPVLVAQLHSQLVAADVKLTLLNQYPADHPIQVISNAGGPLAKLQALELEELDRCELYEATTTLYLPPLARVGSFEAFQETVAHLRAPEGCPWDQEQTHQSLRSHLMEETFEALEAIDHSDMEGLKEELGDLLLQIVLHTQIATEEGTFLMADVIQNIQEKLIRRHPHVFADVAIEGVDQVLHNWEALKEDERNHQGSDKGLLDGVPLGMPALAQADEIQDRVTRVGFDWPDMAGVIAKLQEELQEVAEAQTEAEQRLEMGDLLFSVVNYARWLEVDPEAALRQANQRFRARFQYVEQFAREAGVTLSKLSIEELEALWQRAKEQYEA